MAEKSVSIKLGMDNAEFIKEMKKADREIKKTEKTAQNLAKSLDFKFNADVAVQAQKQYKSALEQTEAKAARLRDEMDKMAKSSGVDTEGYSKLQLELAKTEAKAAQTSKEFEDLHKVIVENAKEEIKEIEASNKSYDDKAKAIEELKRKYDILDAELEETKKDAEQVEQSLEDVKNVKIEQLTEKIDGLGNKITSAGQKLSVFSVAAAGVLAGAGAIGKQAAATGAEIDDMTQRFGISAETVQRWNYIAMQSGVEATTFTNALVKARAAMSDLSSGNANAATETLQNLGISARQFGSDEEMFDGIVKALANVEDKALQTAYANELFGNKIATQLLPYINAGAEDLAKWNAEFDAMPSLTGEEAASLAELDDTFNRLSVTMKYATAQLGEAFAPIIERVVEFIEDTAVPALESFAEWFDGLPEGLQNTALGMLAITAVAAPLFIGIGKITSGAASLIKMLSNLNKAQLITAAGYAALAGAGMLAVNALMNWKDMSAAEKALTALAAGVLAAAAAMTVFHASWSWGVAIGVIAAAVTAGLGLINSAKDKILPDTPDFTPDNIGNYTSSTSDWENYTPPTDYAGSNSYTDNSYSSSDNINITINVTKPNATAEEIAELVGKEMATLAQSRR